MFKKLRPLALAAVALLLFLSFLWGLRELTAPVLPQPGSEVMLYSNQTRHDLRQHYLAAMGKAERSILLIIYTLKDQAIIDILRQKAAEGLDVQVICDRKASRSLAKTLGSAVSTHQHSHSGLMHLKLLVIDGRQVWIGSANMTTESLLQHGNLIEGFYSPKLADAITTHAHALEQGNTPPLSPHRIEIAEQDLELWFLPGKDAPLDRLKDLIDKAHRSVKVAMFTWTHPTLTDAIIEAHRRSVRVEVVLDRDQARSASAKAYQRLHEAGVAIALSDNTSLLHYKMLIIDDEALVSGSANWTRAAFTKNNDCFLVLSPLSEVQRKTLRNVWHAVTAESKF